MKTKLTREDYEGYKARLLEGQKLSRKVMQMEEEQNTVILPWLEERIRKSKTRQKPKKTV